MVFLDITKPTLIRPFLAKECSLFFLIHLFSLEANYFSFDVENETLRLYCENKQQIKLIAKLL